MNLIIATRRYYADPTSEEPEVIVSLERPFQSEPGFCRCIYHLTGIKQVTRYSEGVDEFHALVSALAMAGTDLQYLNEQSYGGMLRWDGGPAESSLPTTRDHWPFNKASTLP